MSDRRSWYSLFIATMPPRRLLVVELGARQQGVVSFTPPRHFNWHGVSRGDDAGCHKHKHDSKISSFLTIAIAYCCRRGYFPQILNSDFQPTLYVSCSHHAPKSDYIKQWAKFGTKLYTQPLSPHWWAIWLALESGQYQSTFWDLRSYPWGDLVQQLNLIQFTTTYQSTMI